MRHAPRPTLFAVLALFTLATLFLGSPALADDAPSATAETPAQRYQKTVMHFGSPAAGVGFDAKGVILMGGQQIGTFELEAKPVVVQETHLWAIHEKMTIQGGAMTREHTGQMRSDLVPLHGTQKEKDANGSSAERTYKLTEEGVEVTTTGADGKPATRKEKATGGFSIGLASLFLFGRMAIPEGGKPGGEFKLSLLETDAEAGDPLFVKTTTTLVGPGKWNGKDAYIVRGVKPDGTIEAAFDPKTRAPLGLKMSGQGKPNVVFEIRAEGATTETKAKTPDFLAQPPQSAKHAAMQAAYCFATADLKRLDALTDWPSTYKQVPDEQKQAKFPTVEDWHKKIMADLTVRLKQQAAPQMLQAMLPGVEAQLVETKLPTGEVAVKFPPMFRSLELVVGKVGEGWRLTRFPKRQ